jgi:hypothetical protein
MKRLSLTAFLLVASLGCQADAPCPRPQPPDSFDGTRAGAEREIAGMHDTPRHFSKRLRVDQVCRARGGPDRPVLDNVRDLSTFPVVEDPHPPEGGGPGALGDILDPIYDDGLELRRLHHSALVAWTEQHPAARGPIVLNIGRFVDLAGNPVDRQGGRTGAVVSRILCDAPLLIAEVQDSSALVVVEDNLFSLLTASKDANLAHQLGHYLGLGHGNGLDDDNNGQLDGICDLGEDPFFLPLSLMSPDDFVGNEGVTSTQTALARIKALRVPGINETVAATRTDSIEEVSNPLVDMGSFSMAVNPCPGKATLLHDMFTDESDDGQRWLAFLDTDGLAGTGGAPADLGFPTSFQGAELVTRIENRLVGEFLQLVPTVWRFESGLFVEVNDPSIEVEGGIVQDLHGPFNYSLSLLLRLDVDLIGGPQALLGHPIRAQVLSQLADVVDRLPDAPAPVTSVGDQRQGPQCASDGNAWRWLRRVVSGTADVPPRHREAGQSVSWRQATGRGIRAVPGRDVQGLYRG